MAIVKSGKLWFVVDGGSLANYPALAKGAGATIVSLGEAGTSDLAGAAALFIDIDLTAVDRFAQLKAMLARVPATVPRFFALDPHNRVEQVHARVLGARATMRRPFTARAINALLGPPATSASASSAVEESVSSAATALTNLFSSLVTHSAPSPDAVEVASTQMAAAIGTSGLSVWLDTVRAHHDGTFQHCLVVTGVLTNFGVGTGMSEHDIATLTKAGLLHDIGKAAVPVEILDKPGGLTNDEFTAIKQHPLIGYDFLAAQNQCPADVLNAVRDHHEYLDGSGYPYGIDGSRIGDLTRIVTICDIYGALIESRSYKPPMPHDIAISVLNDLANRGKVEKAFVRALERAVTSADPAEKKSA